MMPKAGYPTLQLKEEGDEKPDLDALRQQLAAAAAACDNASLLRRAILELSSPPELTMAPQTPTISNTALQALEKLRTAPGVFGLDIGGTLAKMAHMVSSDDMSEMPKTFGLSGQYHDGLKFELDYNGSTKQVNFMSGTTEQLEKVLKNKRTLAEQLPNKRVVASGGGAHRLAGLLLEAFSVEVIPFKEMESLVSGLAFLHDHGPKDEVYEVLVGGHRNQVQWPDPLFPCILVNIGSGVSILRLDHGEDGPTLARLGGTATGGATFLGLSRLLTSAKTFAEALELASRGDPDRANKLVSDIYGTHGCQNLGLPANLTAAHFGKLISQEGMIGCSEADVAAALLVMVTQASAVLARAFAQGIAGMSEPPTAPEQEDGDDEAVPLAQPLLRHRSKTMPLKLEGSQGRRRSATAHLLGPAPNPSTRRTPVFFVGGFLAENDKAMDLIATSFRHLDCGPALFLKHADFLGAIGALAASFEEENGTEVDTSAT